MEAITNGGHIYLEDISMQAESMQLWHPQQILKYLSNWEGKTLQCHICIFTVNSTLCRFD